MSSRVLVVDDAEFMRTSIRMMLHKNNFDVIGEAGNGREAVQKYKELRPDVVTMDLTMPEMSGLDALKTIKQFDPNANIIIVSAMGQEVMVREAVAHGAKTFIVKPFREETMIGTIRRILKIP